MTEIREENALRDGILLFPAFPPYLSKDMDEFPEIVRFFLGIL